MDEDTRPAANEPQAARPAMPSAAELYEMIAEAAYYRAQKRGFTPGAEAEDWLHAETEVMQLLTNKHRFEPSFIRHTYY